MYKANCSLRTAMRVLKSIHSFPIIDSDHFYAEGKENELGTERSIDKTFAIDCVLNSELFLNSQFPSLKTKDAKADYFRGKIVKLLNVDKENLDVLIQLHIFKNQCTVSLDN